MRHTVMFLNNGNQTGMKSFDTHCDLQRKGEKNEENNMHVLRNSIGNCNN